MTSTFDEGPDENTVLALLLGLLSVVEKPTVDSKSEPLIVAITVLKILISIQLIILIADELE